MDSCKNLPAIFVSSAYVFTLIVAKILSVAKICIKKVLCRPNYYNLYAFIKKVRLNQLKIFNSSIQLKNLLAKMMCL